ncbi:TetR/AcrR family transcriptional regulator [Nocardia farcinica]|uniref:Potential acrAB operon repressor n=1 Tax=Nocardia farcinica TaxID=37329 RepID=A0A0H5P556_NOCFR|nr:TetR/AcrR family transcriptional regulator [Nocardia farcinica]AXK87910.1 TetR/AcrR family transcriptional regulator [Nocardia farcinica]MBA4858125.1 TetR/AcrR family transcriptional regulator [Nocardia farcinica]MBC9816655.1 TetR/AcrR family transcriptional regulator [Nocardia farcinica]MBF6143345.1 TetR/AcrR family transcriptional regulator [Nocardia farcinica]MBF6252603.1 TetR/AcrR family transcriptional regulator [Nocardia farcinica]
MARLVHDTDHILDTAARLLRDTGPAGVTVSAVVRAAGVSSGSVYHRFPDRAALLGALWTRTLARYHGAAYPLFDGDPVEAATALAEYTVRWCADNPLDAHVLLTGAARFGADAWPEAVRAEREAENERWNAAIRDLIRRLCDRTGRSRTAVLLAAVDLPTAAVRRYLVSGTPIPDDLPAVTAQTVRGALS